MYTRQETLIQLSSVNKYYRTGYGKVHALKDAGFSVRRGEALAIIGSSGSGKSTLLHILGCLDTDYQGEYLLDGVKVRGLSRKKLADIRSRKIGFIFQKYNLVPELSVYENVELPLIYQKIPRAEREERTERVIRLVGLEDKKRARLNQLSGGQQQRVSIARALAAGPDILLADEPTGALDSATGKEIMDLLLKLNDMGMTLAVVTHDPAIAARMPRIVRISDGRIIEDRAADRPQAQTVPAEKDFVQPEKTPVRRDVIPALQDEIPALRGENRALPVWFHHPDPLPENDDLPAMQQDRPCQPHLLFTSIYDYGKESSYVENHDSFF